MSQVPDEVLCLRCQAANPLMNAFCGQCGQPLPPHEAAPAEGGVSKGQDEIFCPSCGQVIKRDALICVHCGVPASRAVPCHAGPKDKTISIILAILLAFWTWLYTYDKDAWKFWINLGLAVFCCGVLLPISWIWAIIDVAVRPPEFYRDYPCG